MVHLASMFVFISHRTVLSSIVELVYPKKGEYKMLVRERMSHPVINIHPEIPMSDALKLMRKEHVRRFPVVDSC